MTTDAIPSSLSMTGGASNDASYSYQVVPTQGLNPLPVEGSYWYTGYVQPYGGYTYWPTQYCWHNCTHYCTCKHDTGETESLRDEVKWLRELVEELLDKSISGKK